MSDSWIDDTLKSKTRDESYERFKQQVIDFKNMGFYKEEAEIGFFNFLNDDGSVFSWICRLWLEEILEELYE